MPSMLKTVVAALAVAAAPAFAELAVTAPIATTTCVGGQTCQVSWRDDGDGVTLRQQGNMTIALFTGGARQQTFLQPIAYPQAVNVSTTEAVVFTVDPTVGPNSDQYFIRFSSETLTQTGSTQPYLSFSAKFSLSGMSGTFNQTVQDQIASASSSASSTPAPSSTGSSSRTTSATRSATSSTSTGGAIKNGAGAFVAGVAAVAGVVALF